MACPIPAEAPVTMATFPVSLSMRFLLFDPSCVRCCRISVSTGTDVVIVWMVAIFVPIGIESASYICEARKNITADGGPAAYTQEALNETTARAVVERLLRGAADLTTAPRNPGGCLTVQGALACS